MTEAVQGSGSGGPTSVSSTSSVASSSTSSTGSSSARSWREATDPLPDVVLAALDRLEASITAVLDLDVDELSQPQLEHTLRRLQPQLDRVHGYRSRLAAVLAERARSGQGSDANSQAAERARRDAARFLRSELHLTDSEAKRAVTAGQQARTSPSVSQATRNGRINPEQAATIARLLEAVDPAVRDRLEAELVDAAGRMDAVALGRLGRRRQLELDPVQGERRERRDHRRRAFRLTQTSDGAVIPSGRLYGAQAEVAMAAWHAFRRPDARGEVRTPDQRGADAFEQLCETALRAGEAPSQHGERPQLLVITDQQTLLDGTGVVELGFTGPVSLTAVRCLLSDCTASRVGLGAQEVDVSVSKKVRTVPAGLWRALVARDRGCTWAGCDAPAAWCDVAHGELAYQANGHLSPSNAALLCRRHHRAYDHGPYVMVLERGVVRYERQPGAEVAPRERGAQLPSRDRAGEVAPAGRDAQLSSPEADVEVSAPGDDAQLPSPEADADVAAPGRDAKPPSQELAADVARQDPATQLELLDPPAAATARPKPSVDRSVAMTSTASGRVVTVAVAGLKSRRSRTSPIIYSSPSRSGAPTARTTRPRASDGSLRGPHPGRGPPAEVYSPSPRPTLLALERSAVWPPGWPVLALACFASVAAWVAPAVPTNSAQRTLAPETPPNEPLPEGSGTANVRLT
jgi:hypothetical protein